MIRPVRPDCLGVGVGVFFRVLGPLTVEHGGAVLPTKGTKLRLLLATLLIEANQHVSTDRLVDALWSQPTPSAGPALHNHVMRLRRLLGDTDLSRLRTAASGYRLDVAPDEFDLFSFTGGCRRGQRAYQQGDWATASSELATALAWWRGEPLADLPAALPLRAAAATWTEQYLQAVETRIDADLRLGRHDAVIPEITALQAAHPLRERFHALAMLAHDHAGRQADALAVYRQAREVLVTELGVEPGPELRRLHARILAGEQVVQPGREHAGSSTKVRPAQLPADLMDFVGRDCHIKQLADLLTDPGGESGQRVLPVAAVTGVGGIGKTSLAVRVAHRVTDQFPDGQLYADLRGASAQPRPGGEVLARFLRDLGVPDAAVPVDDEERAARYRSVLADRKVLVLLDDARDASQIRPLIPGAAGCAVLVTSRSWLSGMDGATVIDLDILDTAEADTLFAGVVGPDRTAGEPAATAIVLRACGGLPLAIRIAATRLATRPGWTVGALADRLVHERTRLRELNVADLAVRITFQTSYHALPAADPGGIDPARAFRLLGLAPGRSISLPAAAVLFDAEQPDAERALETLVDVHLLIAPEPGRYRFHDLLRVYAAERAAAEETPQARTDAVHRLLHWYLTTATAADEILDPRPRRRIAVDEGMPGLRFDDYQEALRWVHSEHETLLAAIGRAAEIGAHDLVGRFMVRLGVFLGRGCHWDELLAVSRMGLASARACGDRVGEADALYAMSNGFFRCNDVRSGRDASREALAIYRELGDVQGEIAATGNLGYSYLWSEDLDKAAELMERALVLSQDGDGRPYEARSLGNLGYVYNELGQHERAVACCERAVTITSATESFDQALATVHLGRAYHGLHRLADATDQLRRALDLSTRLGAHEMHGLALLYLGDVQHDLGLTNSAVNTWQDAHRILVETSHVFARQAADRLTRST
jgi:DNA-binding SARP family transcriptional activator/tetratricopeptide (TPR) repeat protein